jgi:hypothetical protein
VTGNVAWNDGLMQNGTIWQDYEGDTVTFVLVDDVSNGTLTFDTATGEFKYEQNEGYIGDDSFTYKISDGLGTSNYIATVQISVVAMIASPNAPNSIQGTIAVDGSATSSAAKGMFTPAGDTMPRETTDEELVEMKHYYMQYDGPTQFTAEYTVNLNNDGTFNPTGSTIKLTTVNYTSRYKMQIRDSLTPAQIAAYEAQDKTVYAEGGKFFILQKAELKPSGWQTLSIPITEANLVNGKLHSLKFAADTWYGEGASAIIDKGIVGEVDLAKCKAEFTAKYQDKYSGAIATYVTTGKIKN